MVQDIYRTVSLILAHLQPLFKYKFEVVFTLTSKTFTMTFMKPPPPSIEIRTKADWGSRQR